MGPQFFRGLGRNAFPQVILSVLFAVSGLGTTYSVARALGFDAGTAAGLLAGGLHSSETVGTGSDAIGKLAIEDDVRRALTINITIAYAVTYMVGIFTAIFVLVQLGPWVMRIDLRAKRSAHFQRFRFSRTRESPSCYWPSATCMLKRESPRT
jgi:putative transport protein